MRGKIAFVLGAAAGYVLGSRAGRERYEQIKRGAQHLWSTEPVQNGVNVVKGAVDERTDDLKAFAVRVGGDVFSKLTQSGGRSDPFSTTDDAATDAGGRSGTSNASSKKKPAASKSASSRASSSKPASPKSAPSKSASAKSAQPKSKAKSAGSKAGS